MSRRRRFPRGPQRGRPLQILSANVNKSGIAHATVLQRAFELDVDILLVQEPFTCWEDTRRITKSHPAFNAMAPSQDWTQRPRVLTYARKDRQHLQVTSDPSFPTHPDIMAVTVQGLNPA